MSSNPEKLGRLKQPKSMSMYASQGDMISDLLIDRSLASAEIDLLQRENAALKIDASNHAADAETVRRERDTERRRAEAAEVEVKRLRDLVWRAREISRPSIYPTWHKDANAALASTGGDHHGN